MGGTFHGDFGDTMRPLELNGKVVVVNRIGCYNGFFKDGISYTKVVEYHFESEELAKEFHDTLKGDKKLMKLCLSGDI